MMKVFKDRAIPMSEHVFVHARAPLRLGLAGGGTDVSPYCDVYGGTVLNATINRYAYAVIRSLNEPIVRFISTDLQKEVFKPIGRRLELNGELELHKAVYNEIMEQYNGGKQIPLELSTFCDAPAGSGLGSSSTLVVAMIRAFAELLNLPLDDYTIAHLAFKIERIDCGMQGGRQDQYSATFGGFNFMEFYAEDRAIINPLRIKNWIICELESSLLLFYTGVSRESAKIIADQSNNVKSGSLEAVEAMHAMKNEALVMKECLLKGDFAGIVEAMRQGWKSKKLSAKTVSNPQINEIFNSAIDTGALAGKVSGAGGGGFMMFFVPLERRMDVIRTLNRFGGQVSNCHFTQEGSQAWTGLRRSHKPVYTSHGSPIRTDSFEPAQGQAVPAPHFGVKPEKTSWIPLHTNTTPDKTNVNAY
jgi:D-glycero-alpha-D-manno-heptose-7-phosphate kinase